MDMDEGENTNIGLTQNSLGPSWVPRSLADGPPYGFQRDVSISSNMMYLFSPTMMYCFIHAAHLFFPYYFRIWPQQ